MAMDLRKIRKLIELIQETDSVALRVRDFGKGIPTKTLENFNRTGSGGGVGLGGMTERIRDLGGQLRVESDGSGTAVFARLPLEKSVIAAPHRFSEPSATRGAAG